VRALVCDRLELAGLEVLRGHGIEPELAVGIGPEELARVLGEFEAVLVRSRTRLTARMLEEPGRLKVIGRAGAGVDNIDVAAATKQGVVVMNTPGANALAAAEHTLALMLALCRHIVRADESTRHGGWEREAFVGDELHGQTLGLIGLGNVGTLVCERARCFKMKVLACDPYLSPEAVSRRGAEPVGLEELLRRADFISLHTPLTADTRNLIDGRALALMRPGVRVINCARGGLLDEAALAEAIRSGQVAGAALDVFASEPPTGSPLLDMEEVIVTPHLGASSRQAQEKVSRTICEQVAQYLLGGAVKGAVNLPPIAPEQMEALRPWLELAEKLGRFQAQTFGGGPEEVDIESAGELARLETAPLTSAVLRGLLAPVLAEHVTLVNAPLLARERGMRVRELTTEEAPDYSSLLTVTLRAGGESAQVAGTVFGRRDLRIVRIGALPTEATPEGHILFIRNFDRPGVVGNVGTTLASRQVNIAKMHLGRSGPGGIAVCLVQVDGDVPEEALAAVRALPDIISAQVVSLQ
jgi:D-3-phosphoglycerate dehydrogenase